MRRTPFNFRQLKSKMYLYQGKKSYFFVLSSSTFRNNGTARILLKKYINNTETLELAKSIVDFVPFPWVDKK